LRRADLPCKITGVALGVDGVPARRVVIKTTLLTVGTLGFVVCLTLMFQSMRAVMDVGGFCAEGGAYEIRQHCPEGVAWVMPVAIFGGVISLGVGALGVFSQGGPRPYAFAWSALFLALGWNFLEYGFDPPGGGTEAGWLVCGFVFVAMGGVPLLLLLSPAAARWALWGPPDAPAPKAWRDAGEYHVVPDDDGVRVPAAAGGLVTRAPPEPQATAPAPSGATGSAVQAGDRDLPSDEVLARLERAADLHERGALDDAEYQQVKDSILDEEGSS
jgi:hypothetical protein